METYLWSRVIGYTGNFISRTCFSHKFHLHRLTCPSCKYCGDIALIQRWCNICNCEVVHGKEDVRDAKQKGEKKGEGGGERACTRRLQIFWNFMSDPRGRYERKNLEWIVGTRRKGRVCRVNKSHIFISIFNLPDRSVQIWQDLVVTIRDFRKTASARHLFLQAPLCSSPSTPLFYDFPLPPPPLHSIFSCALFFRGIFYFPWKVNFF